MPASHCFLDPSGYRCQNPFLFLNQNRFQIFCLPASWMGKVNLLVLVRGILGVKADFGVGRVFGPGAGEGAAPALRAFCHLLPVQLHIAAAPQVSGVNRRPFGGLA